MPSPMCPHRLSRPRRGRAFAPSPLRDRPSLAFRGRWQRYHARGLMMIGVPPNDSGGQEPTDARVIAAIEQQLKAE